jgi:hypothetical protein
MAKLLVGIDINHKERDLDFKINLPDDVIEQVEYMYKRALKKSGMDEEDFGPTYYEQLKKEDKELADMLETAVYVALESIMYRDSFNACVLAMDTFQKQDRDGDWYQVFSISNKIDIDLTDFPRLLGA